MSTERTCPAPLPGLGDDLRDQPTEVPRPLAPDGRGQSLVGDALQPNEERFRKLLESVPDGVVVVSAGGRIEFVNRQTEKSFGFTVAELVGQPLEVLLPERFQATHVGQRDRYFASPQTRPMGAGLDLHGRRKDGTEFPVEISLSPLHTPDGLIVIASVRDVSDRKRLERDLLEKNAELKQAIRAKDTFLEGMSHELRTPLNAIIGFTGTLLMGLPGPLNGDQEEQLKTVESSATHLLSLINDLLDLAKIESGKVELRREPVACRPLVQEVLTALRPLAEAKGLVLEMDLRPEEFTVPTDPRSLRQILLNLANNALKFTEVGHVRVAARQDRVGGRVVTEFVVADTGVGIRPEDQARLFQAFEQLETSTLGYQQGTGLGLHLSRKLAGLLGGRIHFRSEYGRGSEFILTLEE